MKVRSGRGAALQRGVRMIKRLSTRAPRFAERLAELNVSESTHVAVQTIDGGPRLLLDPERIERNVDRIWEAWMVQPRILAPASPGI